MRATQWAALSILVAAVTGCGAASRTIPAPSHQGLVNELPGNQGYFEIGTEGNTPAGRSSGPKKPVETTIVVHFYGADGTTEMSPAPTEVTVKIGGGDSAKVVPLSPQIKGGFASAPGPFSAGFRGRLNAKIGGEPVEANFMIR
jgi:hypothetical protein